MEENNTEALVPTAEQVEAAMVAQANQQAIQASKDMNPADIAAQFFSTLYPQFEARVAGLSNKDARRLCQHLVQFPLHDDNPHFYSKAAKEAFGIGIRLIDAKLVMRETIHMENLQNAGLDKQAEAELQNETNAAVDGSETKENE